MLSAIKAGTRNRVGFLQNNYNRVTTVFLPASIICGGLGSSGGNNANTIFSAHGISSAREVSGAHVTHITLGTPCLGCIDSHPYYTFTGGSDGSIPQGALLLDSSGALMGRDLHKEGRPELGSHSN